MNYKMVVSDFDDTLLRSDETISEETVSTISKFCDKGGIFALCTGRMTSSALREARNLNLKGYVIAYQGGVLAKIDTGEILIDIKIDNESAISLMKELEKENLPMQIYVDDRYISNKAHEFTHEYERLSKNKATFCHMPIHEYLEKSGESINKMLLYSAPEKLPALIEKYSKLFPDIFFVSSKSHYFEATAMDAQKGRMVEKFAKLLKIKREEIICIGDGLNDISMVEFAGLGVAVANGQEQLKMIADEIAPSCDDDGVRKIIEKYCL